MINITACFSWSCHTVSEKALNILYDADCSQLDDMLAEHRKQLKTSQKTTLDQLHQEYDVDTENTRQCYRAEVWQWGLSKICIMKSTYKSVLNLFVTFTVRSLIVKYCD